MHKYNLFTINREGKPVDILGYVNNISWSTDSGTVGKQLSFSSFKKLNFGKYINLKINNKNIFIGTVMTVQEDKFIYTYTCMDLARYLNKNKVTMQFTNTPAWIACGKVCSKYGIKHDIPHDITTKINKIYKNSTMLDVIKDILNQYTKETGKRVFMEMDGDIFKVYNNLNTLNINTKILQGDNASKTHSIQDIITKVEVISKEEKDTRIIRVAEDKGLGKAFGVITEQIELEEGQNEAQAYNIANKYLEANKWGKTEVTMDVVPITYPEKLRANRFIDIDLKKYHMENATVFIKSCSCNLENNNFTASITCSW